MCAKIFSNASDSSAQDTNCLCISLKAFPVNSFSKVGEEEVMKAMSAMGTWGQTLRQTCY